MYYEMNEEVAAEAEAAAAADEGLRERVRTLVTQALVARQADPAAVKEVLRAAVSGIDVGLNRRGEQAGEALREAVKGLDEAVARSAYAVKLALEEAWSKGDTNTVDETREAMASVQDLEQDLLSTLKQTADGSQRWLQVEFSDLAAHLGRTGTDTGAQVRDVMQQLGSRVGNVARETGADAMAAASTTGSRLREVTAGILRGLADAIDARAGAADQPRSDA